MSIKLAYNQWAEQYDTNTNLTRDLEASALREVLTPFHYNSILEIGCGTGKNTVWLAEKASQLVSVDFSEEMLARAKEKIIASHVRFVQADINQPWDFVQQAADLVSFSLVLEHIADLEAVFEKTAAVLKPGGLVYIGELHPFKQYSGSKARFETSEGTQVVECYTHHLSDFTNAAAKAGLKIELIRELFDDEKREGLPRLLVLMLKKQTG